MNAGRVLVACVVACLALGSAGAQTRLVGTIPGQFDVTNGGAARYSIPLRIPAGTAGTAPELAIAYDSQSPSGVMGAGWTVTGASVITRGPRTLYSDGSIQGVKLADSDSLLLDGQKLVKVSQVGTGASSRIEYRKELDDVTRVKTTGVALNSAKFVVQTKGGLTLYFDGSNNSTVRTSDGAALRWMVSRIVDSTGNYIEFRYLQNGLGEQTLSSVRYTGHETRSADGAVATDRLPYASIDFAYDTATRPLEGYLAGRLLRRTALLKGISTKVTKAPSAGPTDAWRVTGSYQFDYEERPTLSRYVLTRVRHFGDDGRELEPTQFSYSLPTVAWAPANFQVPVAVLAEAENFSGGFRFGHFSSATPALPDLLFSAQIDGKAEAFAYRNTGGTWERLEQYKPPFAFVSEGGADLGALVLDLNGDGRIDLLQSQVDSAGTFVRSAYLAGKDGWESTAGYQLPFALSEKGQRVAQVVTGNFSGTNLPDLLYQRPESKGFVRNTGTGWKVEANLVPPNLVQGSRVMDVDCDGKPELLTVVNGVWRAHRLTANGWEVLPKFDLLLPVDLPAAAFLEMDLDGDGCKDLLVSSAKHGIRKAFRASPNGWEDLSKKAPTFDLADASGPVGAVAIDLDRDGVPEVVANRLDANNQRLAYAYRLSPTGWQQLDAGVIPLMLDASKKVPISAHVLDLDNDGFVDIAMPRGNRSGFGSVYAGMAGGFTERPDYAPPLAFSRKDQQDQGVRFVDLNGDGLPDILFRRETVRDGKTIVESGAYLNTGKGWVAASGLVPPEPFAGESISGNPVQLVDVDGDGYIDLLYSYQKKDGTKKRGYYRNVSDGQGGRKWEQQVGGLSPPENYPFSVEGLGDQGVRLLDLNGDGRVDLIVGRLKPSLNDGTTPAQKCKQDTDGQTCEVNRENFEVVAFLNDGTKWVQSDTFKPPVPFVYGGAGVPTKDLYVQLVDLDGDGLVDIAASFQHPYDPTVIVNETWMNTSTGWTRSTVTVPIALDTLLRNPRALLQWIDINGDGLVDLVYTERTGTTNSSKTWLSTGAGFVQSSAWQIPLEALADRGGDQTFRLVDVNGDGLLDVVYSRKKSPTETESGVFHNTGSGWAKATDSSASKLPPLADENGLDLGVRLVDVNGDGLLDLVQSYASGDSGSVAERRIELNAGRRADVLLEVAAGYGIKTTILFRSLLEQSLSGTDQSGPPWARVYERSGANDAYPIFSPVPTTYVVSQVTSSASGGSRASWYRYGDFKMHLGAMRPLGFGWREVMSRESRLLRRSEYFQRSIELAGRLSREATCVLGNGTIATGAQSLCPSSSLPGLQIRILGETINTWRADTLKVPSDFPGTRISQAYLDESLTAGFELDGNIVSRDRTSMSYDTSGDLLARRMNVTGTVLTRLDGTSIETQNKYDEDNLERWYFGRLTESVIRKAGDELTPGGQRKQEKRTNKFSYDATTGLVRVAILEPGDAKSVTTTHQRDRYGNIVATTLSTSGEPSRSTRWRYDGLGRFIVEETNALKQSAEYIRRDSDGLPQQVTDPNGLTTTYEYDGLGRITRSTTPAGVVSTTTRLDGKSVPHATGVSAAYAERSQVGTLPAVIRLFDAYGRLVRTATEGFTLDATKSRVIYADQTFDVLGRPSRTSLAYDAANSPTWRTISYDSLDRPIEVVRPDGKKESTTYGGHSGGTGGRTVVQVDAAGRKSRLEFDTRGLLRTVEDAGQGKIQFGYDGSDRRDLVRQPTGAVTRITYDSFGLRRSVTDPDRGLWQFEYDAFGQVRSRTDAKGQIITFEYDLLGRLTRRSAAGSSSFEWKYDTASSGIGRVSAVRDPGRFERQYFYDAFGRLKQTDVTIGQETFSTSTDLDQYGRPKKTRYSTTGAGTVVFENIYDQKGFVRRVTSENSQQVYWEALDVDAAGRVRSEQYGNGVVNSIQIDERTGRLQNVVAQASASNPLLDLSYEYDDVGNVRARTEKTSSVSEKFEYDALDRLVSARATAAAQQSFRYDASGRITFKSDVGDYDYRDPTDAGPWQPHHAVVRTSLAGTAQSFGYDSNGNLKDDGRRTIKWTADDQVSRVTRDTQHWAEFAYDSGGQRYSQAIRDGANLYESTFVGSFERVIERDATTNAAKLERYRYFLSNPSGVFAVVEVRRNTDITNPGSETFTWYLHRDSVGSILRITDQAGKVAARYWYDAWGRQVRSELLPPGQMLGAAWRRGFGGHEHLPEVQLVNMNARMYDYRTGQFISADASDVTFGSGQGLGRFRYAANNPLRYSDPTGLWDWGGAILGGIVGFVTGGPGGAAAGFLIGGNDETREWVEQHWKEVAIVAVAVGVTVVTGGTAGPILAGMAAGAASGGLQAALYGGSLADVFEGAFRGAVIGGISAGAFYAAGSAFSGASGSLGGPDSIGAILSHGVVGGATNSMQGGDFWAGFAAASFTKASTVYGPNFSSTGANVMRAALVGGTASALSGGKFANGAVIGAFSYAFNDLLHRSPPPEPERNPFPEDALGAHGQLNIGGFTGNGPKMFDVTGDHPHPGFSVSSWGTPVGVGFDSIYGTEYAADRFVPNVGPSLLNMVAVSVSPSVQGYSYGGSVSVRVLSFEYSVTWSANSQRIYQWVESSIYNAYGVRQYP